MHLSALKTVFATQFMSTIELFRVPFQTRVKQGFGAKLGVKNERN